MIRFFSGEFIFRWLPNGGSAVLFRSLWTSIILYILTVGFKTAIAPGHMWQFDWTSCRLIISETIPWLGTIFAAAYVAYYSRFAAQWSYLANLYNQIMMTSVQNPPEGTTSAERLEIWEAGFIEDAEDLHLATKPMFAMVIKSLLNKPGVRSAYIDGTVGGKDRLENLEDRIKKVIKKAEKYCGKG